MMIGCWGLSVLSMVIFWPSRLFRVCLSMAASCEPFENVIAMSLLRVQERMAEILKSPTSSPLRVPRISSQGLSCTSFRFERIDVFASRRVTA